MDETRGCHARFSFLDELYINHLDAVVEVDGDDSQVLHQRTCGLRSYLVYLVGTYIFVDKGVYYADVVYLRYFIDFEHIHEYNWGVAFLVYLCSGLGETFLWKTR